MGWGEQEVRGRERRGLAFGVGRRVTAAVNPPEAGPTAQANEQSSGRGVTGYIP